MALGAVSSFPPDAEMFVTSYGMLSVSIMVIQDKNLWVFRRYGQITNRFSIGNINGTWKQIRGISGSLGGGGGYHR